MKKNKHPESYRFVIFQDISSSFSFLGRSTADSSEMASWEDGKEYPVVKLSMTSGSHPFFTGNQKFVDSAGRIEKFQKKYGK
ncbi:type B 50S ribosomal protein L31 [bacterium]|jgi:large subunit ribosomal protein L31|nr:type B 50S ribosomal protein L31 [bacterium]NBX78619.1 type B 50S ribosomal protein L31 [bacterium]